MSAPQTYRERLPTPETASHVASVWALQVASEAPAYEHRAVPNGSVEISYETGTDILRVSGPQRAPTVAPVPPGTTVIGVRLRPGAAESRSSACLPRSSSTSKSRRIVSGVVTERRSANDSQRSAHPSARKRCWMRR